ncbi:MAG: hypothetical protein M3T96_04095 [Acidobacteriota bacterium]|nr:hypothetical protein [Acidobacteriota bacterium]
MCETKFFAKLIKNLPEFDKKMQARTRRQKEVFDYIKGYIERFGSEPSYQMIARELGVRSKAGIARHIKALETQGLLKRRRENGSFWIDFTQKDSLDQAVCEIEWLNAAQEENSVEEWENAPLFVPRFLLGFREPGCLRAWRVSDDAMREKHICEGDIALIEKRAYARDGNIVAARIENKSLVLKQYFRLGADVELRSANEIYETIKFPANKIELLGIFRGLLRPLV